MFAVLFCAAALAVSLPPMPAAYRADSAATFAAAQAATTSTYPNADAVIVDDRLHTRYEPDGSDIAWDDEWIKVLTEKGRRGHASVSVDFSARYGDAAIQCVEIVGTNGVVRTVDFAKTLKTSTDNSSLSANIVDPQDKKTVCAVPGLAVGEIRHVVICRRTRKARMRNAWADLNLLESFSPILATTVTVDQPAARPLAHAVVRHPQGTTLVRAPDRSLAGGRTLLQWSVRHVPQVFPEPDMPSLTRCAQTLRLSTVPDWPTVSRWYWSLCTAHLAKTSTAMTNQVAALVKGCPDEMARIRALFRFVSQEVRYMGLTLEDDAPGYEPHDVDITFANRYGVCRDKAALLVAMLRLAGIPAYPVLIHAGTKRDPEVPDPFFNHAIVAVADKTGYILMDPTDESARDLFPSYLSDKSYLVARPEGESLRTSPVPPYAHNLIDVKSTLDLSSGDAALYSASVRFNGLNDNVFRRSFLAKKPLDRRRQLEGWLRRMAPGAELLTLALEPADLRNTEQPLVARVTARLPGLILAGRTRQVLTVPLLTRSLNVADMILDGSTSLETRRFPLELASTCGAVEHLAVTLGDSVGSTLDLPADAAVTNVAGYAFQRTFRRTGNTLAVDRSLALSALSFDVPAYDALRNARKEVETAERSQALFRTDPNAEAHVHTHLTRSVFHFRSPHAWTVTNTVVREALTYRGKQQLAEMKFGYAPSVKSVTLVSATVSNRNGRVQSVTPKEINLLDCGWAASAPRYPASKLLVVNLPGVEIGSTVRYTCATTVTNAPIAYSDDFTFDSTEPLDLKEVEFHVPDGIDWKMEDALFPSQDKTVTKAGGETVYRYVRRLPPRLKDEPHQPPAEFWRSYVRVSLADWKEYGRALETALAAARASGSENVRAAARACTASCTTPAARITAIRTFLAHRMRTSGPGLFELPFAQAFSAPDRALADGYASSADYRNLLYVMLEEAGFDCSFVLADNAAGSLPELVVKREALPDPDWFDSLVVRAEWHAGDWWNFLVWPWCDRAVFYVDGENEYTPPEACTHVGDTFFDPHSLAFGKVAAQGTNWVGRTSERLRLLVRENGATDFEIVSHLYGPGVGGFRRRFAEILPEMRSRFHQQLVGELAQNASATSDLVTDVKSYPAETSFSAYVEGFATVQKGAITVVLPAFSDAPFSVGGPVRETPFVLGRASAEEETYEVVFPKGYALVERLPEDLTFAEPSGRSNEQFLVQRTTCQTDAEGRLRVVVTRHTARTRAFSYAAGYFPLFRDWNRRATAPAARTLIVRANP